MTREEFLFDISDLPQDGYRTLHKVLSDHDAEQRQIIDEQVEENRGLRSDVLLMQKEDASQRALIEQQAKEIARLRDKLERISRHVPIMGSTGDYRHGQLDVLESVKRIAEERP